MFFVEWNPALCIITILNPSGLYKENCFKYVSKIIVSTPLISHTKYHHL